MTVSVTTGFAAEAPALRSETGISASRFFDLCLFAALFTFMLLFQLQEVAPWISKLMIREILYALLYMRIILFYRRHITYNFVFIMLFLLYALFVGIHTAVLYGPALALKGLMRFLYAALLAPPAAILFTSLRQVKIFIKIWLAVFVLGFISALYQFFGGDLSTLFQGYISSRGGMARYMTILGEPNIGGMAAVIVIVLALLGMRSWAAKSFFLMAGAAMLLFSISKAALLGLIIALAIIVLYRYKQFFLARRTAAFILLSAAVLFGILIFMLNTPLLQDFSEYSSVLTETFTGQEDSVSGELGPSFIAEIWYRIFNKMSEGIEIAAAQSDIYSLNILGGSSFGVAGTAAVAERGFGSAILPHNGYLEIFLVGGLLMLFIFFWVILVSFVKLQAAAAGDDFCHALFVSFIIAILFMAGYPIFNQPVLGAFLWLLIGIAANSAVLDDAAGTEREGGARYAADLSV